MKFFQNSVWVNNEENDCRAYTGSHLTSINIETPVEMGK